MKRKHKVMITLISIGIFLTILGHFTINEFGGFKHVTKYWWYWVGCLSITTAITITAIIDIND